MARKPRIEFPGAFYHVIARGNNRQKTFVDNEDYRFFLERLNFYKERFKFILYAYVLMPNHIHLLIETGDVPLSKIMQSLQFTYTQKFNYRHKKVGHLFQGRYKAILCQKESYLLELIRYIVLNPVRAHLVKKPIDWFWSSYYDLLRSKNEHVVSFNEVLGLFGKSPKSAINALQKHTNDGLTEGHNKAYYKLKDQRVLGDDDFAHESIEVGAALAGDFEYYNLGIDDVVKMVAEHMGIGKEKMMSITRERVGAKARGIVAYICKKMCGKTVKEVSKFFGRSESSLSEMMKRVELEISEKKSDTERLVRQVGNDIEKGHRLCCVREVGIKNK